MMKLEGNHNMPEVDKFLVKYYGTFDVLNLSIPDGLEYYASGIKMRQEERLYQIWTSLKGSMGGAAVPSYTEFVDSIYKSGEEEKNNQDSRRKLGTIKGVDITTKQY